MSSMTWREAVERATSQAKYAFDDCEVSPPQKEFIKTFKTFYDELVCENKITLWPVDPAGSHRMAEERAAVIWADDYSNEIEAKL